MADDANDVIARVASRPIDHQAEMQRIIQRTRRNVSETIKAMIEEGEVSRTMRVGELLDLLDAE